MIVYCFEYVCSSTGHPSEAGPPEHYPFIYAPEEAGRINIGPTLEESWEYKLGPSRGNREDKLGPLSRKAGSINLGPNWLKRSWIE